MQIFLRIYANWGRTRDIKMNISREYNFININVCERNVMHACLNVKIK